MILLKPNRQLIFNIALSNFCLSTSNCYKCKLFRVYSTDIKSKTCLFSAKFGYFLDRDLIEYIVKEFPIFKNMLWCNSNCDQCSSSNFVYVDINGNKIKKCLNVIYWIREAMILIGDTVIL